MTETPEDPRKTEHDVIGEWMPPLNMMGANASSQLPLLNQALRLQLTLVQDELSHYLNPSQAIPGETRMPHEWGSLDTYDDMRNSLRAALSLIDELIWTKPEDEILAIKKAISEGGNLSAVPDELLLLVYTAEQVEDIDAVYDDLQATFPEDD